MRVSCGIALLLGLVCIATANGQQANKHISLRSPDGRNCIRLLQSAEDELSFSVSRDGRALLDPSPLSIELAGASKISGDARWHEEVPDTIDESFALPWGKCAVVRNRCNRATVRLQSKDSVHWEIELRSYDDGVAYRYRILEGPQNEIIIVDEATEYRLFGTAG